MTDGPELHDFSRLDAHMAARRRATVLHSLWRPVLAGAVASLAVSAAIWVVLPKVTVRDYEVPRISYVPTEVPRVTMRDVTADHVITRDVEIPIPRIVESRSPEPRSPEEKAFVGTRDWDTAIIRGRILRPEHNGFVLMTDSGEQSFYPARIGADGKPELDPSAEDIVAPFIGDLARCNKLPVGIFACVAEHEGEEVFIRQTPIAKPGRPT